MILNGLQTFWGIRRAVASSRRPIEELRRSQEDRLRSLVAHAYENVPLYRDLYDEAGFHPREFRSLDDLGRIPLLEKARLKAAKPEEVVARGIDPAKCHTIATSGSTGTPLKIYLGSDEETHQRVTAWRILFEHGFRWTDRTMEIRMTFGPSFGVQRLGIAPKDWVSILEPPETWAKKLIETGPAVVVATATSLRGLAEALEREQADFTPPRLVISDSETLTPEARATIRRGLRADPVDVYGLVELSNFAWECERREGFHLSADSHLVEVDAPIGEAGPIVATDLGLRTMPIIRYNTGDLGEIEPEPCPCGRTLPKLKRVHGRAVDSVLLPGGRRLFWPYFHERLGAHDDLQQWRIIQEETGSLTVQLVVGGEATETLREIEEELRRDLAGAIDLRVERVPEIRVEPGEKTRMVISKMKGE